MTSNIRTALITGANRGIGLEVAHELALLGMRVVIGSRNAAAGARIAQSFVNEGLNAIPACVDVSSPESIRACADELRAKDIHVNVLVNNAAILRGAGIVNGARETILDAPDHEWREIIETNFMGTLWMCRAFVPAMNAAGYGRVVNVSTSCAQFSRGLSCEAPYSVSKVALNALTLRLSREVAGDVKVNAVDPGWVRTAMGGDHAPRSIAQGAATIVWAATLPSEGPTGGFFRDRTPIDW